jgi:prepilin-type processing-associated H-X9-DG protein
MKQIALGFIQYCQDYDETTPKGIAMAAPVSAGRLNWMCELDPYVKSTGVYFCPSDPTVASAGNFVESYAINANFGPVNSPYSEPATTLVNPALASQFRVPVRTVMLVEIKGMDKGNLSPSAQGALSSRGTGSNSFCLPTGVDCGTPSGSWGVRYVTGYFSNTSSGGQAAFTTDARHNNGANYALCDGHVKWLKGDSVSEGFNNPTKGSCAVVNDNWYASNTEVSNCTLAPNQQATFSIF